MSSSIISPFPFFTDTTGAPLESGYIYIGQSNLNPETAPVNVFWDAALTIPAAQPVRTVGGYPSRAGTPSRFYSATDTYSITVRNKNHVLVFSAFDQTDSPSSVFDISTQLITATAGQTTFTLTTFNYLPGTDTLQVYRNGLRLNLNLDYLETNSSTVTLTAPAAAGDQFLFQGGTVITGNQVPGSQVSFLQAGTGAVTRNMQDKARESVSVLDFGAVGDGVTDDTAAIQAAIDSLGVAGGTVTLANEGKYLVGSSLVIKAKVLLKGAWKNPDIVGTQSLQTFSEAGSCIRLASSATINMQQCASLENVLIYRNGMTFPVESGTGYTGTAITASGSSVALRNLLVMGFNKLFYGPGNRHVIDRVYGDNNNGIEITNSPDVCYISNCHMWPFASDTTIYPSTGVYRSGIAYYSHDTADWIKFTNCFSYGYKTGFKVYNAKSNTLIGCGTDQNFNVTATYTDSIGFDVSGNSDDTKLIGCQSAACWYGVVINTVAGQTVFIDSFSVWYPKIAGIYVAQGNLSMLGGLIRNTDLGITTDNASSVIHVSNVKFNDIATKAIFTSVQNKNLFVTECDFGNYVIFTSSPVDYSFLAKTVASADPLVLPVTGNVFRVSGTTSFGSLRWGWVGREVTLIFDGSLTVFNGTASVQNMRLSGAANFAATVNTSLTLKHDGVQWFETGRSA